MQSNNLCTKSMTAFWVVLDSKTWKVINSNGKHPRLQIKMTVSSLQKSYSFKTTTQQYRKCIGTHCTTACLIWVAHSQLCLESCPFLLVASRNLSSNDRWSSDSSWVAQNLLNHLRIPKKLLTLKPPLMDSEERWTVVGTSKFTTAHTWFTNFRAHFVAAGNRDTTAASDALRSIRNSSRRSRESITSRTSFTS